MLLFVRLMLCGVVLNVVVIDLSLRCYSDLFSDTATGWVAGTSKKGRNLHGQFYHTTDGGKTFTLEQVHVGFILHFTSHLFIVSTTSYYHSL